MYDLFDNMQDGIPGQEEADKKISEEVDNEILAYEKQFPGYNWEALRDLCFSVVYTAKREWFTVGFHYAVELMGKDKQEETELKQAKKLVQSNCMKNAGEGELWD